MTTTTVAEYVYGVVRATASAPSAAGIGGAPVHLIAGEHAAALASHVEVDATRLGREELLAHTRVLEAALAGGVVLPMRFGVVMDGAEEVRRRLLDEHGADLVMQLDDLAGKVEVRIHALYLEDVVLAEIMREDQDIARLRNSLRGLPDGATYYGRIKLGELVAGALARKRERDTGAILDALGPFALASDVGPPAHERTVVNGSFLIAQAELEAFDAAVERVAGEQAGRIRFKYTGPLPPHSFVHLEAAI